MKIYILETNSSCSLSFNLHVYAIVILHSTSYCAKYCLFELQTFITLETRSIRVDYQQQSLYMPGNKLDETLTMCDFYYTGHQFKAWSLDIQKVVALTKYLFLSLANVHAFDTIVHPNGCKAGGSWGRYLYVAWR